MMLTRPSKWWRPRCSASQGARNLESTYDDRQERSSGPPHNMWDGVYLWQSRFGEPTWGRNEGVRRGTQAECRESDRGKW